jgi:hypothetical protein
MSLRGTLGDFGLADIFQLIGQQAKTGVLSLKDRDVEVKIAFVDGNVVKADRAARERNHQIGDAMVRAGVATEAQLAAAHQTQQRTMRRLGDVLVDTGVVSSSTLKEFSRLQTTETIYAVFQWRSGTYEFTTQPVSTDDAGHDPIRSDALLMEGMRMVDEWPVIRRVIPAPTVGLQVLRALSDDGEAAPDGSAGDPQARPLGELERRVFALVTPGCSVGDVVDRSRLGEFEASRVLAALVHHGLVGVVETTGAAPGAFRLLREALVTEAAPFVVRCVVFVIVAALAGGLVRLGRVDGGVLGPPRHVVQRAALGDQVAAVAGQRLRAALAIARVEHGRYPQMLDELVVAGLLSPDDLTFPFATPWGYRAVVAEDRYDLAMPLR